MLTAQEQQSLAQALTATLQTAINTELAPGDDPIEPNEPIDPEPSEVPGVGNDLRLKTDGIEMKIENNDPIWDS